MREYNKNKFKNLVENLGIKFLADVKDNEIQNIEVLSVNLIYKPTKHK